MSISTPWAPVRTIRSVRSLLQGYRLPVLHVYLDGDQQEATHP